MRLFPRDLCWVPRIGMYPLVVVLAVATYENRIGVRRTVLPLSAGGGCESVQYELFGVLSVPNLAFIVFAPITIGVVGAAVRDRP